MKLVLMKVDGEIMTALGSSNSGEVRHKFTPRVVVMADHPVVYDRFAQAFPWDWTHSPGS